MGVVLDRLARGFLGRLEQGPDIDVEADTGEGRGDDLGAAVVAVLAELDDEHARPPPLAPGEGLDLALDAAIALVALVESAIDAGDRADGGAVAREHRLERVGDLAHRGAGARRLHGARGGDAPAASRPFRGRPPRPPRAPARAPLAGLP